MSTAPPLDALPVEQLPGVGPRIAERLRPLGIATARDVLLHLPLRYEDRTRITPIAGLRPGDTAQIEGRVTGSGLGQGRRRALKVWLKDASGGGIALRFFHFTARQAAALAPGTVLRCFGEVREGYESLELIHPEYQRLAPGGDPTPLPQALSPVYPTTEGVAQASWRVLTEHVLALSALEPSALPELLPEGPRRARSLPPLGEALRLIHRPPDAAAAAAITARTHPAVIRLALEELTAHQASLRLLRRRRQGVAAPPLAGDGGLRGRLLAALPFRLTEAQTRVVGEIAADLAAARPMLRLLQGDVGSGKTIVAALAALQAVEAGYQAALMAPTELLAEQHLRHLTHWLAPLGERPLRLTGRDKGRRRDTVLAAIASGAARVVVGTHALLDDAVTFQRLGLAIVDEQHRFGVHQRMRLKDKGIPGGAPHQLIMTATPIPRSLAMTVYADLDLSVIDELPPGRTPVTTLAIPSTRREEVIARVGEACAQGRQAYWVCTLIDESEALECQAAEDTARDLAAALAGLRVGLVHGRHKAAERDAIMTAVAAGEIDLLVATTVIEVGVDVPNASLMIIENAERLGLAQLHQLRGRVGRGTTASHCVLLYRAPLSEAAHARLATLRATTDGFEIARCDLALRGPGEVLGTRQTGEVAMRIADPMVDAELLPLARETAEWLLDHRPGDAEALIARWLGRREGYGEV